MKAKILAQLGAIGPNDSIWIYQSNRVLNDQESQTLLESGAEFAANWSTHGKSLQASVHLVENLFVIVRVDKNHLAASGCSIDKSVKWVKDTEDALGITLLDRLQVAWIENGTELKNGKPTDFEASVVAGKANSSTLIFNNTVNNGLAILTQWMIPASQSWLSRFAQKTNA
jgi:hypothetical protein